MTHKRILFHGSIAPGMSEHETREICAEFGAAVVTERHCALLCGPGALDLVVADAIARRCTELGASSEDCLQWIIARQMDERDPPELRLGRRIVLDKAYAYASFARLRTYLVQHADAVITVGGQKGVLDVLEKARLANKPFFPIGRTGGESREQWLAIGRDDLWFCTARQFQDLCDLNLAPRELIARIFRALALYWRPPRPRAFIVHGHDGALKYELKDYIQNTLKLGAPVILQDEPAGGRTIIEKFEGYAAECNVVFVLLTPDDYVATATDSNERRWRARQNVILELGYFLGKWPRKHGRVLLLHKGSIEIPSDIAGVTYISIDGGIQSAGEHMRRELGDWLSP
jgi:predicted nucleotide-binding protein